MNARDDYPLPEGPTARSAQRRAMLNEIDQLRAERDALRAVGGELARLCLTTSTHGLIAHAARNFLTPVIHTAEPTP